MVGLCCSEGGQKCWVVESERRLAVCKEEELPHTATLGEGGQ
jgi:hypothetical protein